MSELINLINCFTKDENNCDNAKNTNIVQGTAHIVGELLLENNFSKNILLVADNNTLKASEGVIESLKKQKISYLIYRDLHVATMDHVFEIERYIMGKDISVLAVGARAVAAACSIAASRQKKKICIFAVPQEQISENVCDQELHFENITMPDLVITVNDVV